MGTRARTLLITAAAVLAVAVGAQLNVPIPGSPVPQSLQTLAVVVAGATLGPGLGALALVAYLVAGAVGLPVFADGAGGLSHLTGPTSGYLLGFVMAAALVGWWVRQPWGRGLVSILIGVVAAHGVILTLGWMRLAPMMGAAPAFSAGVAPFLFGGMVKSVVAAAVSRAWVGRSAIAHQQADGGA